MPFYRITIKLRKQYKPVTGIRELATYDIDEAWRYFKLKAETKYSAYQVLSFEVVMVSKLSEDVKNYLKKKRRPPLE